MTRARLSSWLLLAALAAGLLVGTCILPYRFPPRDFVVGASFEVGFNNAVSFLFYVALIPLIVLIATRLLPVPARELPETKWPRSSRVYSLAVASVVLAHVLLFAAVYAYKGRFVFADSLYFQSLLYRMTQGEIPYVDFGFYYGPLMLYPGYWLTRVLGLDAGYGVWFVTNYVVGLVFLAVALRVCLTDARVATVWFVFLALGLFSPLTALSVTLTRYLFSSIVFLAVVSFFRRGGWRRGAVATASLAAALLYSFDVASLSIGAVLALMVAYVGRSIWMPLVGLMLPTGSDIGPGPRSDLVPALPIAGRVLRRGAVVLPVAGAVCAVCFLWFDPSGRALKGYPEIARSYSGGAFNVPVYPHLPFLALAGVTIAALSGLARLIQRTGDERLPPAALPFAILALATQRAAFGVAEPSRIAYYGLPVILIGLFVTTRFAQQRAVRAWLAGVLLVGVMLPMQYYNLTEFLPFISQRLRPPVLAASGSVITETVQSEANLEPTLRQIVQTLGTDRPYLMYDMEYSSLPVYRDLGLRYPTYATMLITARDHAGIQQAIEEVRAKRAIVVIRKQDLRSVKEPNRQVGAWRLLDVISGAHSGGSDLSAVQIKSKTRLMAPFLEFLQTEYAPLYDRAGFEAFGAK